jgi:hypothetical protein
MRPVNRNTMGILLLAAAAAVACVLLATHSSASASPSSEPAPPSGYHKPTGPELTPTGAATDAMKDARPGALGGQISMRVAYGNFAQARAVVNSDEEVGGPTATGKASCFPGLACTAEEVEQHEREQRELDETSVYAVEMEGASSSAFAPPAGVLKRGATVSTSSRETLIIDAHTGFPLEMTIGGKRVNLEDLGPVTVMLGVMPEAGSGEFAAVPSPHTRGADAPPKGMIRGRVTGLAAEVPILVSEGNTKSSPLGVHLVAHTRSGPHGAFELTIRPGRYSIEAQRPNCPGKRILVRAGKTTLVTLACSR